MKQVLIHKGQAIVSEVPAPYAAPGEVLVRVQTSCLSVGTELSGLRASAVPLWKKALMQPEKIATTIKMAASTGLKQTLNMLEGKRDAFYPTGYSAAGIVVAVGAEITNLVLGDRVACAGSQCAYHAEFIRVPENLCVTIPELLDWDSASTVTLGAIALQGVRRAQPTLGETFVVSGLGILGQLTVQLLKVNGCKVIGIDPNKERVQLALGLGMDLALNPDDIDDFEQVVRLTDGLGTDGVIITAATSSDQVVSTAFKVCRKKGRVVLVGDVGLHLNREDFYVKEIDFLISTSYGPGRYDIRYEEHGLDYPAGYVRWTENRNMKEYIRLVANGKIQIQPLVTSRFSIIDAGAAYASLTNPSSKSMMILLNYPGDASPEHRVRLSAKKEIQQGKIKIALVGAGSFACSTHLPNLKNLKEHFIIHAIVSRTGHNAATVAKQFNAAYCTTNFEEVLADKEIDAVIIATRHDQHASMALAALTAGKHVLLEKPLALNHKELDALDDYITQNTEQPIPVLLTGYNRRFSPYAKRISALIKTRSAPFILNYRMNAGYMPEDHWVHGREGGGRNLGEACHIYDLFTYLANSKIINVSTHTILSKSGHYGRADNFITTLSYADGSVAALTYTSLGFKDFPKETADLYVDGKLIQLNDYKGLEVHGIKGQSMKTVIREKGFREELLSFAKAIYSGKWAISWQQQLEVARVALKIEEQIANGMAHDFAAIPLKSTTETKELSQDTCLL